MLPQKLQILLPVSSAQQLNSENDQAEDKHKQTDAVDPMHITDPLIFWTVRVFFPQVEVF